MLSSFFSEKIKMEIEILFTTIRHFLNGKMQNQILFFPFWVKFAKKYMKNKNILYLLF